MKRGVRLIALIMLGILTPTLLGQSSQVTTVDAFSLVLNYTGVPGGIIKIGNCEEDTFKQPLRTQGLPLREVLNTIAKADPRYRWLYEDGGYSGVTQNRPYMVTSKPAIQN